MNWTVLFLTCFAQICIGSSIDWCEYWRQLGKEVSRPECMTGAPDAQVHVETPQVARNPEFSSCPDYEIISCKECEQQCNQLAPQCSQAECSIQCVCQPGFARTPIGECVPFERCPPPPRNLGIYRMVPSLVRGVIRMISAARNPEVDNQAE